MKYHLKDKRQTPEWILDSYLEKPKEDMTEVIIEKNDSTQNNYSGHNQKRFKRFTLKANEYIKPTDYYF